MALRGVAIDERLDDEPTLTSTPPALAVLVRLTIDARAFQGPGADASLNRLEARLAFYGARNIPLVLALGSFPSDDADVEPWRQFVRLVTGRGRGKVAAYQIGDTPAGPLPDPTRYAYLLKLASVQIRSVDPDVLLLQGRVPAAAAEWQARVYAMGVGPYENGLALAGPAGAADEAFRADVARMEAVVDHEAPSGMIVVGPIQLDDRAETATAQLVDTQLRALGTKVQVTAYRPGGAPLMPALAAAAKLGDLFSGDLVALDETAAGLRISQGGVQITARVPHRLLYSLSGLDTYLVYWGTGAGRSQIDVEVSVANALSPMVRDPSTGSAEKPARVVVTDGGKRLRLTLTLAERPLIVDFSFGAADTYTLAAEAQKPALPRVEEIIFRHQQAQAAQDAALQNYIAHVRIEQHFHPTAADAAYNVTTENRLFSDKSGVEWEELSFALNGAKWTSNRPAFPMIQPEKVLSLPLDLRLNQDYVYRLERVETVGGREAFVIRFDPIATSRALYRGTVWIDRRTFVRLKVQSVETELSGVVVSNEETQQYEQVGEVMGRSVWLFTHLSSQQIFLIAGRNVLVEREMHFSDFQLNASDFEAARAAARAGSGIMYRDTDQGLRYFVKKGETRVVSEQVTTSVKAMALGTDIDPSFDFPLPIGGLDVLDFNFLHRNMQLALLFGGVIALGNIQHPNLWGGRFDASVDFFGLALKANDSVFDSSGERADERVNRIPIATGFNVGYQLTPFQKLSGHYEFKYDAYFRDVATSPTFVMPTSTATHGEGISYEYRRRGYSLAVNGTAYQRMKWERWGFDTATGPAPRTFTRYDVGLSKDFVFRTFHTIHLNGTYFGGERLDRFSMYQFGLFDATRMHGVPSAVRFGDLAMFRGAYSFNVFDIYRFDLSVDRASGRQSQGDGRWLPVTGLGVRLNMRAPRDTILQVDVGKSILPEAYRGAGSTVIQILLLKPL